MKELLLEQLQRTPIIQIACEKVGVSRASLYRWKEDDPEFAKAVNKALTEGIAVVNDAAESQLLAGIKNANYTAVIFWLKNNHTNYRQRMFDSGFAIAQDSDENLFLEVFGELKPETKKLIEPFLNNDQPKSDNHEKE